MFTDENQEDVTLENDVTPEEEEETVEETETESDSEPDWKAEAKKWEAIAKRKAKKAETTASEPQPASYDEELIQLTYKNHLSSIGLSDSSVQEEAIALAKKLGTSVAKLQNDSALMEVLQAKQRSAVAKKAVASSTGGSAIKRNDTERLSQQITSGKAVKEDDVSGGQALEMLGLKR